MTSAVVVVDIQNDYVHADGAIARMGQDTAAGRAILPAVHRLVAAARGAGAAVIYVRTTHGPWTDTPAWRARGSTGGDLAVEAVPLVRPGTWGAELFELSPRDDELVVTKHRYSAFAYTALELNLHARGCDTVLLAGVQTDVCVEATATDALMRGFRPVLVRDAAATATAARQADGLRRFTSHLGEVVDVDRVAACFRTEKSARDG